MIVINKALKSAESDVVACQRPDLWLGFRSRKCFSHLLCIPHTCQVLCLLLLSDEGLIIGSTRVGFVGFVGSISWLKNRVLEGRQVFFCLKELGNHVWKSLVVVLELFSWLHARQVKSR